MSILVVYASRYRSAWGIAERIAANPGEAGQTAELRPAQAVGDLTGHDAFVIGGSVSDAHWLKEAANPRDHRVFFGALDPGKLNFAHRMIPKLPAARAALSDGDPRRKGHEGLGREHRPRTGAGVDRRWGPRGASS